jgi:hypothetical protein
MRTTTSQEDQVFKSPGYASRMRVRIADENATLQDMTALSAAGGADFTRNIRVEENADSDFATSTFALHRQVDGSNISPNIASRINDVETFLKQGRTVVVDAYTIPLGFEPVSGDWHEVFRGTLGSVDEDADTLTCVAHGLGHELADASHFLEKEYQHSGDVRVVLQEIIDEGHGRRYVVGGAMPSYSNIIPSTHAARNGYWYQLTGAAVAVAPAEPVWPTTIGATVAVGASTATCMGTIPLLYTPVDPVWTLNLYNQKRVSCWSALKTIVAQLGWEIRYRYDSGTAAWRLTFSKPARTSFVSNFTWHPDTKDIVTGARQPSILQLPSWRTGIEDVRNALEGAYSDPLDLDLKGNPKRKTVMRENPASIDEHGRRWMFIAEASTSQIDTQAEMERMLDELLLDMKDPFATQEVVLPLFWPTELGDQYTFKANNFSYSFDQLLAIVSLSHEQGEKGAPSTRLACRGRPSAGLARWRAMGSDVAALRPVPFTVPAAPTGLVIAKVQGGVAVTFVPPVNSPSNADIDEYELHVSTTTGFTPDATSFKASSSTTRFEVGDLDPGVTYYAKIIARDVKNNRGTASAQVTIAAGYTVPRAMQPLVDFGSIIPNSDFEAQNVSSAPPDRWSTTDIWGTDVTLIAGWSGTNAIRVNKSKTISSDPFTIREGDVYSIEVVMKNAELPATQIGNATMQFFSDITNPPGSSTGADSLNLFGTSGAWSKKSELQTVPAGTKYAYLNITNALGGGSNVLDIDSIIVSRLVRTQYTKEMIALDASWTGVGGVGSSGLLYKDDFVIFELNAEWTSGVAPVLPKRIGTIPAAIRPTRTNRLLVKSSATTVAEVIFEADGEVWYQAAVSGAAPALPVLQGTISWRQDP